MALNKIQSFSKRSFDIFVSLIGLIILGGLILLLWLLATISTKKNGLYGQVRVGKDGSLFKMYKLRTMRGAPNINHITVKGDSKITRVGQFMRFFKLDEMPQLYNVLIGEMSMVGPRPDVPGYADKLKGDDRIILSVKPGITGPATLKYRNEEEVLSKQIDPITYNNEVIWKDKVVINKEYVKNWTFLKDIKLIVQTIFN